MKKYLRIFISQPMLNRSNDEIKKEREEAIQWIKHDLKDFAKDKEIIIIDSFFENCPHEAQPLWYLGEAIKLMSEADAVVFLKKWELARGCQIEMQCAVKYGKQIFIYREDEECQEAKSE